MHLRSRTDWEVTNILEDSAEWIECMTFSPDQRYLAVGSHDNYIYIYDAQDSFSLVGKCKGHSSYITAVDFSQDGQYLRSNCGAYELLFWKIPSCDQDPSGRSNTKSTAWATQTVKFCWSSEGIYPKGTDGTHVNSVTTNADQTLLYTGDDFGLVSVFNNPCRFGSIPRSYRGHSEHVTRVVEGDKILSAGGQDKAVLQWIKN